MIRYFAGFPLAGQTIQEVKDALSSVYIACVAGVKGEGEGERERGGGGEWGIGMREHTLQRPPFFHPRPPIFM